MSPVVKKGDWREEEEYCGKEEGKGDKGGREMEGIGGGWSSPGDPTC